MIPLSSSAQSGVLTPEKLWGLQRVALVDASADGSTVVYNVTSYDISADKGTTSVYSCNLSGATRRLTDGSVSAQAVGITPEIGRAHV